MTDSLQIQTVDSDFTTVQGAEMLKQLLDNFNLTFLKDLVIFWLAKGVSLALAEPIVKQCAESMDYLQRAFLSRGTNWQLSLTKHMLQNSELPVKYNDTSTLSSFLDQFCDRNVRWETLGIFLSAVVRATFDIPFFPSLYTSETARYRLRRLATRLSNCSLEICLSLDCLNDLQLIFQYENFIIHTYVDGDHSKRNFLAPNTLVIIHLSLLGLHSWRSLGDVIASIFALGYHENIQTKPNVPAFLVELRRTAFARVYSADKNVAIFLGRPPRMTKRFSYFQIPSSRGNLETDRSLDNQHGVQDWDVNAKISYRAEARWSAVCAFTKEEILELLFSEDRSNHARKARSVSRHLQSPIHCG